MGANRPTDRTDPCDLGWDVLPTKTDAAAAAAGSGNQCDVSLLLLGAKVQTLTTLRLV